MSGKVLSRVRKQVRNKERGQTTIESGLVFGFLVILVVGILEMSLYLYNYAVLTDAAKEGVRYAVVHGSSRGGLSIEDSDDGVTNAVTAFLAASVHDTSGKTVSVDYPDGNNAPGDRVQVTVSYSYNPLFLSAAYFTTVTISATSVGRIQF